MDRSRYNALVSDLVRLESLLRAQTEKLGAEDASDASRAFYEVEGLQDEIDHISSLIRDFESETLESP